MDSQKKILNDINKIINMEVINKDLDVTQVIATLLDQQTIDEEPEYNQILNLLSNLSINKQNENLNILDGKDNTIDQPKKTIDNNYENFFNKPKEETTKRRVNNNYSNNNYNNNNSYSNSNSNKSNVNKSNYNENNIFNNKKESYSNNIKFDIDYDEELTNMKKNIDKLSNNFYKEINEDSEFTKLDDTKQKIDKLSTNYYKEINDIDEKKETIQYSNETEEEKRNKLIKKIINEENSIEKSEIFSLENEKQDDAKCYMLSEIDTLITYLNDDGVDISKLPTVNSNSDYKEIETLLKILKNKHDFTRYCSSADELIIFGSYVMEDLFDGEKKYFGYSPNLTGWHNSVNVKLKRMKQETSKIVSSVMDNTSIGPVTKILLELVPNMILYSKNNKSKKSK